MKTKKFYVFHDFDNHVTPKDELEWFIIDIYIRITITMGLIHRESHITNKTMSRQCEKIIQGGDCAL